MWGEARLRALADQVLAGSRADATEVVVSTGDSALTRFANSAIHQNVAQVEVEIRVRAVLGTRVGVATTTRIDERALREVTELALEHAQHVPENPHFPGLPAPRPIAQVAAYVEATAAYTPERRARDVKVVCDLAAGHGLNASGAWSTSAGELAVANSLGVWAYDARTHASFKTVVMSEDSSGYAERTGLDASQIDVEGAGREAVDKTLRSRAPVHLDPGTYPVVLEPYAVGTMIDYLSYIGLGAQSVQEQRSFLNGHFGAKLVGENITLWDDGLDPNGIPMAFDYEGMPKQRVTFFEQGVATAVVFDSYTAGRSGTQSTGHALPAPNTYGPMPLHLFLAPGDADEVALRSGIERGLWVTRFHYVNVVHPTQAILTGMTRDGTFLIENGEITRPVHNLRFTQSVLEALSNVQAIGSEARMLQDEVGGTCVPALRIGAFTFSSATQF